MRTERSGVAGDMIIILFIYRTYTVELQWLEHLWDEENMFETAVVRANEC